ncbi:hypothetical protein BU24DRAFT_491724 [Aaosphaeria arxii CBS 175.79]|uniref:Uncharacterized protein n=1 Tax=Aaosphaeria arxii CBS 175.79 TaxID=1450172 RepID=A0A6A5XTB3_9PLEO|nr:uncharacterized protein BU24DRAFT_491724 [Aaosphaeria arxii CBS 175.79]KAF2015484.1 hypothetical protein BU24DRAFT_491724 [Aaosphaeria arxii CBS 175.79]
MSSGHPVSGDILASAGQSLPNHIKERILGLVGRQGVFAYQIASGSKKENDESYVQKNAWHEPFTYQDWADLTLDEWDRSDIFYYRGVSEGTHSESKSYRTHGFGEDARWKRRLFCERERGYRRRGEWSSYHNGSTRWKNFKTKINDTNRQYVRRIAVSHWMALEDLEWISTQLPALEALDLSDIDDSLPSFMAAPREGDRSADQAPDWRLISKALQSTLEGIKWLGIRQNEDRQRPMYNLFTEIVSHCHSLETLSIRGQNGYR